MIRMYRFGDYIDHYLISYQMNTSYVMNITELAMCILYIVQITLLPAKNAYFLDTEKESLEYAVLKLVILAEKDKYHFPHPAPVP